MLTLTECAVKQLRQLLSNSSSGNAEGLRLDIEKGGCAGYQYVMKIGAAMVGDVTIEDQGVRVYVSAIGAEYLKGCTLDYLDGLNDAGFRIENPNAERSCGCGTSFEPKKTL